MKWPLKDPLENRTIGLRWLVICGACYSGLLLMAIHTSSVWTDEAFSAYLACHRTLSSLASTLMAGDSSDLQMAMYYVYLHCWTILFGFTEFALRAANSPFIIVFAFVWVWTSLRIFRERWLWIGPACLPFLWSYAGEARPYFALMTFGAICFASLLAYLEQPDEKEQKYLPWLVLAALFLGTAFDMLMLLCVAPLMAIVLIYLRQRSDSIRLAHWKPALWAFAVPFAALLTYVAWTFRRGTAYDYEKPGLLSMGSLIYRFLGLSGYGPNRHFDIPFRPYLLSIGAAAFVLLIAFAGMLIVAFRSQKRLRLVSLVGAVIVAALQALALSVLLQQQVDVRHLAALVPLLLLLPLAAVSEPSGKRNASIALFSTLLLGAVWLIADCRMRLLPEYQNEDFRSAVNKSVALYRTSKAAIAMVADPAGAAYYGLDLQGDPPCFPLKDSCSAGFAKVPWEHKAPAVFASGWSTPQIVFWLNKQAAAGLPAIVIISRGRHPAAKGSPWWPVLLSKAAVCYPVHGFFVYYIPAR
jgi:hypothetical protein